jgi:hypothetical protein
MFLQEIGREYHLQEQLLSWKPIQAFCPAAQLFRPDVLCRQILQVACDQLIIAAPSSQTKKKAA